MELFPDYEDLLRAFNAHNVKYLIVGAYAVAYHTEPRFTKDIDIWARPDKMNAKRVYDALAAFGAPLTNVRANDFATRGTVYQIGVAPVRIDIITELGGISFEAAWKGRNSTKYGKTPVNVIGINELIAVKQKAGRGQDNLDVDKLAKAKREKARPKP